MWYQDTVNTYHKSPDDFICPLVLFTDKTFVDPMRSNFNLEPVSFTLAIFRQECRELFKF